MPILKFTSVYAH